MLSVFGGKITTYRRLAEHVLEQLKPWFPETHAWTASEALPGGDFGEATAKMGFDVLFDDLCDRYPKLPGLLLARIARRHGTLAREILGPARSEADLGESFGGGLFEVEARWFIAHEWAREADDILWRRTKCGLHMSVIERQHFSDWMLSAAHGDIH
jgi:glycerol-3-phosphate dehydrogenase